MNKSILYGIGINDADYPVTKTIQGEDKRKATWRCPYYIRWNNMLERCYSNKSQEKRPTYKGCSVCEGWLLFSTFKKWMEQQEWEGRALDKDFLIEGNKVYSPDTCVFIPIKLNSFITTAGSIRGDYPLGVNYKKKDKDMINEHSKPYVSYISNQSYKRVYLGYYFTPEEAHQVYLKAKLEQCVEYMQEFNDEDSLLKGLTRIHHKIQYHIENNLELISF